MKTDSNHLRIFSPSVARNERGATMLEYALLASLIAMVAVGSMGFVGTVNRDTMYATANAMNGVPPQGTTATFGVTGSGGTDLGDGGSGDGPS